MSNKIREAMEYIAENANKVDIKGKEYSMVQDRIEAFRSVFGDELGIRTYILTPGPYEKGQPFVMRAEITRADTNNGTDIILAAGHAVEFIASDPFTKTSFVEVCETSAIGRALAAFGLHGGEYASAEELKNVPSKEANNPFDGMKDSGDMPHTMFKKTEPVDADEDADDNDAAQETDVATKRMRIININDDEEAEHVRKFLVATGTLANNIHELTSFWKNNEKVVNMLRDYGGDEYNKVIEFFKTKQEGFPKDE